MVERDNKGKFVKGHKVPKEWRDSWKQKFKGKHFSTITEFKKGNLPWIEGKNHTKKSIKKMSGTKKRLIKEGLIKTPFVKGHKLNMRGKDHPNFGATFPFHTRKKMSASLQGITLEEWKKFVSREPYDQNFSNKFKRAIRKRDNQICMNCGVHREKLKKVLFVHHINYDRKLSIPQNCISLCNSCHSKTNTNRPYWTRFFQDLLSKLYDYQYSENKIVLNIINSTQLNKMENNQK